MIIKIGIKKKHIKKNGPPEINHFKKKKISKRSSFGKQFNVSDSLKK